MYEPSRADRAAQAVTDPTTSPEELMHLARTHPELHASIAAHPNVYPDLLDWLEAQGDPNVARAVAERRATGPGASHVPPSPKVSPKTWISAKVLGLIGAAGLVVIGLVVWLLTGAPAGRGGSSASTPTIPSISTRTSEADEMPPSSDAPSTQTPSSPPAPPPPVGMVLSEIAAGNFESLQGTWTEIASAMYDYNVFDVTWRQGGQDSLVVAADEIVGNYYATLQGKVIANKAEEAVQSQTFNAQMDAECLVIASSTQYDGQGGISFTFCPEGSAVDKRYHPDNNVSIGSLADTIIVATDMDQRTMVFARDTVQQNPPPALDARCLTPEGFAAFFQSKGFSATRVIELAYCGQGWAGLHVADSDGMEGTALLHYVNGAWEATDLGADCEADSLAPDVIKYGITCHSS